MLNLISKPCLFDCFRSRYLPFSIGLVYFWFGILKFFPGISCAEELAKNTIHTLSFELISPEVALFLLAIMETAIGIALMTNKFKNTAIYVALFHMVMTFTPLFLFSAESFTVPPAQPTIVGQYILKNLIIIGALLHMAEVPVRVRESGHFATMLQSTAIREPISTRPRKQSNSHH